MPLGDKAKAALPLRAATLKQASDDHAAKAASGKLVLKPALLVKYVLIWTSIQGFQDVLYTLINQIGGNCKGFLMQM